jgi:aryl-alcohol dehydrogenase-like predicted oxidoreductase
VGAERATVRALARTRCAPVIDAYLRGASLARIYDIVEVLVEITDDRGVSAAQVALARLLGRAGVASVIIGAHRRTASRQPPGRRARAIRRGAPTPR